jgi:hypothetical protein
MLAAGRKLKVEISSKEDKTAEGILRTSRNHGIGGAGSKSIRFTMPAAETVARAPLALPQTLCTYPGFDIRKEGQLILYRQPDPESFYIHGSAKRFPKDPCVIRRWK